MVPSVGAARQAIAFFQREKQLAGDVFPGDQKDGIDDRVDRGHDGHRNSGHVTSADIVADRIVEVGYTPKSGAG